MTLHTVPALAARRRPLKPLLAQVLTGEPWTVALHDPVSASPAVTAACAVSYISRRHARWHTIPADALGGVLAQSVARDRVTYRLGEWPFLDALERLIPVTPWSELEPLLAPYRSASQSGGKRDGINPNKGKISSDFGYFATNW